MSFSFFSLSSLRNVNCIVESGFTVNYLSREESVMWVRKTPGYEISLISAKNLKVITPQPLAEITYASMFFRQKRSVSFCLFFCGKPALCGHWRLPFFRGIRAYFFSFFWTVERYVS